MGVMDFSFDLVLEKVSYWALMAPNDCRIGRGRIFVRFSGNRPSMILCFSGFLCILSEVELAKKPLNIHYFITDYPLILRWNNFY